MKITTKHKGELGRRQRVRAKLLLECSINDRGFPLCPQCGKLPDLKDGRGELHLCHEKSLAQGGRTSYSNCYLACRACHNGENGHRTEVRFRSQPVDKTDSINVLLGHYGSKCRSVSVESQTGIKKGKES